MSAVFIVSAPSGSGKSTLVGRLLKELEGLSFSVSYTTRPIRGHEKPGHDYFYISREEFAKRLENKEFLEHAVVFGNYYGTHRRFLDEAVGSGRDLVLDIDVQGAAQLKERLPEAVTVFILPPSRQVLEERLRARSEDAEEVIRRRLRGAAGEIRNYRLYDYVVVNDDVEESVERLKCIVRAERARRTQMEPRIRPILESFEQGDTTSNA
ncbi:MAG TPA: guanylate kinase [Bryobacteraceae bacterium]|nr:guanylate kinase [Bryobacteraceae bacterium]